MTVLTILAANNAITVLAQPLLAASAVAYLATTTGELFPSPAANQICVATLTDALSGTVREIVWITARDVDTVTITRAQEGTTAVNWLAGDYFSNQMTAGQFAALQAGNPTAIVANYPAAIASVPNQPQDPPAVWDNNGVMTYP